MEDHGEPAAPEVLSADTSTCAVRAVRRDYVDLRDQIYQPSLSTLRPAQWPEPRLFTATDRGRRLAFGIRDQGRRSDCVGQALATLIDIQIRLQTRDPGRSDVLGGTDRVSATMLYRMARYHDAYGDLGAGGAALAAASANADGGVRTLRSAIKAFYHHGACLAASADRCEKTWPDTDDDEQSARWWPTSEQACSAENRALGAYYRLLPILNHYHAALRDTETILVSARIHDGWKRPRVAAKHGRIDWDPDQPGEDENGHAFLIVGYTGEGFLVLNSWGEGWGEFPGPDGPLAGVALWTYQDWAANVLDGWVLRLGIAGAHVFPYAIDQQGVSANLRRSLGAARGSVPHRELRGQFLNLEDGDFVETGVYATPRAAAAEFDETMRAVVSEPRTKAIVLRFPGFLEPLDRAFQRAASLRADYRHHGIEMASFFWSANFASQILKVVTSTTASQREEIGARGPELDRRIELALGGIGRAFWRDIGSSSFKAVFDTEQGEHRPGRLGKAVIALERVCREEGKPIHVIAEGAGAMVAQDLVNLALLNGREGRLFIRSLSSVTLVFATVPVDDAHRLIKVMTWLRRAGKAATILVPDTRLEEKLSFAGYGGTVNQLMSRAFVDRRRGQPRPMLGMSFETMRRLAGGMFAGDGDQPNEAEIRQKMAMETRMRQVKRLCEAIPHSAGMRTEQKTTLLSAAPEVQRRVKELILNAF